jgi:RNA polymerase primary sigma factor
VTPPIDARTRSGATGAGESPTPHVSGRAGLSDLQLARQFQNGDQQALGELTLRYDGYLRRMARKYHHKGFPYDDLMSEATVGFIKGLKHFDPERHVPILAYTRWWVKTQILQYLARNTSVLYVPVKKASYLYKINAAMNLLKNELGREPSPEEVAAYLNAPPQFVTDLFFSSMEQAPLESEDRRPDSSPALMDTRIVSFDEIVERKDLEQEVLSLIECLPEKRREIVLLRFGLCGRQKHTLKDIGEKYGMTKEGVRQNLLGTIKSLRDQMVNHLREEVG